MRLIAMIVLLFGVVLAGGGIYFASEFMAVKQAQVQAPAPEGPKLVKAIVAKAPMSYGTPIVPDKHLKWAQFPEESLPKGAFTDAKALLGEKRDDGSWSETRYVLRQIEPGELILESKITGFGEERRMAMQLEEGRRAFTISIDAVSGVAGFVAPGDRVDVLMTRKTQRGLESVVILENVRVIAVDQKTDDETNRARVGRTATVDVTSEDAQKLALAQQLGRLSLTLRGYQSDGIVEAPRPAGKPRKVDVRDLLGEERKAPQRTGTSVTIRKGGSVSDRVTFE